MNVVDWINMFALAVNEENAAGGRVVTAPTNGACGIIPAVLAYYDKFIRPVNANSYAISGVRGDWRAVQDERLDLRRRSGLSGGSGRSLFDGGGRVDRAGRQPGAGVHRGGDRHGAPFGADLRSARRRVQVPCIERNAISAVKAVNAARMAMRRTSEPRVCLDKVIETMYETGKDMNAKYRETSVAGWRSGRGLQLTATANH